MSVTGKAYSTDICDTLPKYILRNFKMFPSELAMREKDYGIWYKYTWKDVFEKVKYFSLGLMSLGLEPGDKVIIIGENEPEYFWSEWAVQCVGATPVCVYPDSIPNEIQYIFTDSESKFAVCEDQEQVDKFLEIVDKIPLLKKIIYWDEKGMFRYQSPMLNSFNKVLELGYEYDKLHPSSFEENVNKSKASDIAALMYTSGTTGLPKGTIAPYSLLIDSSERYQRILKLERGQQYVTFISPAWATEQCFGIVYGLSIPLVLNFPEEPETVDQDIREIGPEFLMFGPRQWEGMASLVHAKMLDSGWIHKAFYNVFMPLGEKLVPKLEADNENAMLKWFYHIPKAIADILFFRPLKDKLGLLKLKNGLSGGAAMAPEVFRFYNNIGIKLKNAWGLSETGFLTLTRNEYYNPDTVGQPVFSGVKPIEIRIEEDGSMYVRGGAGFHGYYKKPEKTRERFMGSWFITGDAGSIDEWGNIIYFDRVSDLRELSNGYKYPPQYLEIRLRYSPYIRDVLIIGDKSRPYVTALIDLESETISRWAERNHVIYTTYTELSQDKAVLKLIREEVAKVNKLLPEGARVKKFANFYKPLDPDEGELTRTKKLRREFLEQRYSKLIDALYSDESEYVVETEVKYRDGRVGKIQAKIGIEVVEEPK